MSNGKDMTIFLILGLIKRFIKVYTPYRGSKVNIKVELDLNNYATKPYLKNVTRVDVSSFASKTNLTSLETEVDKLDIAKLTPVPNDLAKLSNVVKKYVVKKTEYNKLVTKVDNIDTTRFVLKTKYDNGTSDLEKKISDEDKKISDKSGLVKKTDHNSKISKIEGKIHIITRLATNSTLTTIEDKIPNVSGLVKKTDYNTKISEIEGKIIDHNHDKYITTPEFNNLAARVFIARLAQANLVTKTDFYTELKKISDRVPSNKSKPLLIETELRHLQKFDSSYFRGRNRFKEDGVQNYLAFQPMYKYF